MLTLIQIDNRKVVTLTKFLENYTSVILDTTGEFFICFYGFFDGKPNFLYRISKL